MKVKGFTLVELMVVMAIIAFLSIGAYAGITFALRQGRDTQRTNIARQIQTGLTAYYADFQSYPGCGYNGSAAFTSGTPISVDSLTDLYYCPGAFDNSDDSLVKATGQAGLSEYFENEFAWGPFSTTDNDNQIRYYYIRRSADGAALRSTVCVLTENPRGGNVTRTGSSTKDCYCVGQDQSAVACVGMQPKQ